MRKDAGVDGDAQRLEQLGWMFFLKIFDDREKEFELLDDDYRSPLPEHLRWRNWATDDEGHHRRRAARLRQQHLFPKLKELQRRAATAAPRRPRCLRGRQQLHEERHADAAGHQQDQRHRLQRLRRPPHVRRHLREAPQGPAVRRQRRRILHAARRHPVHRRAGQSRGSARPVLDPACGTGGFLVCAIEHLRKQAKTPADEATHPGLLRRHREEAPAARPVHDQPARCTASTCPSNVRHDNTLARPLRD